MRAGSARRLATQFHACQNNRTDERLLCVSTYRRELAVARQPCQSNASALGTLVERTTRFPLVVPLKAEDTVTVRQAFVRELRMLPAQLRRSFMYDQRPTCESAIYSRSRQKNACPLQICTLPESGERTRTLTNVLLCQLFPKDTRFTHCQ